MLHGEKSGANKQPNNSRRFNLYAVLDRTGIGVKSPPAQDLFWLEKHSFSGQGVIAAALTRRRSEASAVDGTRMTEFPKKITDDPYGAAILIRRLVTEQGFV